MSAKLAIRSVGHVTVIDVEGRLALSEGSVSLRATMLNLLAEGHSRILLNLTQMASIDSSGIGELVAGHVCIRHVKGIVKVAGPSRKVRDLLEMTRLTNILDLYESEEAALKSFT